ncbi:MAG: hypothetical protein L0H63_13895 [Nitrococcus sp.]|nr:hypothetical protein [Nitrococcus sp.]
MRWRACGSAGFARALKVKYQDIELIAKGMIWSPSHGDTAFTVPLFDEFMRRIMPGDEWNSA